MAVHEKEILEAVNDLFHNKASNLGIVKTDQPEISNRSEFQRNIIKDMFDTKATDSRFYESLTSAFHDIHSFKYISDPTFNNALDRRLRAIGIPIAERQKAMEYVTEINKELGDGQTFDETEIGWHPDLAEIVKMTNQADTRDFKATEPYSGGGPAPKKS